MYTFEKIDSDRISINESHILYIKWGDDDIYNNSTKIVFTNRDYIEINHDAEVSAKSLCGLAGISWRDNLKTEEQKPNT